MREIPEEYIYRAGINKVADFFAEKMMSKRVSNYVPVFIDDYITSFIFVECDKYGYPKMRYHKFISFMNFPTTMSYEENSNPFVEESKVIQKEIEIWNPAVTMEVEFNKQYIFMWNGKTVGSKEVPIEELSVKELQKLSQEVIQRRNDFILDQAFINRFIK